jgi:hypothetical protein
VLVPDAMANLAPVSDGLSDEQVLGAESGGVRIGDTVAVFAQRRNRPVRDGRGEVDGRHDRHRRHGAGADGDRAAVGADHTIDFRAEDPVDAIMRLTDGRGVDVAIKALGT